MKIFFKLFLLSFSFCLLLFKPQNIYAAPSPPFAECKFSVESLDSSGKKLDQLDGTNIYADVAQTRLKFDLSGITKEDWSYFPQNAGQPDFFSRKIRLSEENYTWSVCDQTFDANSFNTNSSIEAIIGSRCLLKNSNNSNYQFDTASTVKLIYRNARDEEKLLCQGQFKIVDKGPADAQIDISSDNGLMDPTSKWNIDISKVSVPASWNADPSTAVVFVKLDEIDLGNYVNNLKYVDDENKYYFVRPYPTLDSIKNGWSFTLKPLDPGVHTISLRIFGFVGTEKVIKVKQFQVLGSGEPTPTLTPTITPTPAPTRPAACYTKDAQLALDDCTRTGDCDCSGVYIGCVWCDNVRQKLKRPAVAIPDLKPLCNQLPSEYRGKCWECQNSGGIWSAIGCLPTDLSTLLSKYIFTTGVGIAGGIAFLSFLYGIFLIITSSGNAEKLEEAKQIIMSALSGLFLIIFSVFLLRVIGIDILQMQILGFK